MEPLIVLLKPFVIQVTPEREELYQRLKAAVEEVETILNQPELTVKHRLRALSVLATIIKAGAGVLKDIQLDELERDIKELRQEVDRELQKREAS